MSESVPMWIVARLHAVAEPWWQATVQQMLYASVIFVLVAVLARRHAARSPALLYAFWGLVIWRLVLPVALASPIGLATLLRRVVPAEASGAVQPLGVGIDGGTVLAGAAIVPVDSEPGRLVGWLLVAWVIAALLFAARSFAARRPYVRLARRSAEWTDPVAELLVERWRKHYGIRRRVRLVSDANPTGAGVGPFTPGPFTVGTVRPIVYVPARIARRPQLLEATLAHELAHIRRFDDLRVCCQEIVRATWVLFPLVHWAVARMRFESERLCDRLATAPGRLSRRRYAAALQTILAGGLEPVRAVPGMASTASRRTAKRNLLMRFESLVVAPRRTSWVGGVVYLALIVLVLPMAPMVAPAPALAGESPAATVATSTADAEAILASMINPLSSREVTSPFGQRPDPFGGEARHHTGIDIKSDPSATLAAPADGVVELATERWEGHEDWGTVIILDHGAGVQTVYAHLDSLAVETGATVQRGQRIGAPGSTGKSTGPHLHFEIHRDGEPIDPASVITAWR